MAISSDCGATLIAKQKYQNTLFSMEIIKNIYVINRHSYKLHRHGSHWSYIVMVAIEKNF